MTASHKRRTHLGKVITGTSLALLAASTASGCAAPTDGADEGAIGTVHQATFGPLGSTEAVQVITTLTQLRQMSHSGNYRLGANIDASDTENNPFVPVGTPWSPFTGTLDGNGFTIDNLHIAPSPLGSPYTGQWTGLIGNANTALIKDVHLTNVDVKGDDSTGALVGYMYESELEDCSVTGTVKAMSGAHGVGLLVGQMAESNISRSSVVGSVTGGGRTIGGVVGKVQESFSTTRREIKDVFANVTVKSNRSSGTVRAGGLSGNVTSVYISDVNVLGTVIGRNYVGGMIGQIRARANTNSYKTTIRKTLFRGDVNDNAKSVDHAGSFGGDQADSVERCESNFWDTSADDGSAITLVSQNDEWCNLGFAPSVLMAPHDEQFPHFYPFFSGEGPLTQEWIDANDYAQCKLHSGTDGDWGFGYCQGNEHIWNLNPDDAHISLRRIPDPSIQPVGAGLGSCTVENAIDLGSYDGPPPTVYPANACVKFTRYMNWESSMDLQVKDVSHDVDFRWVNCDASGSHTAPAGETTEVLLPANSTCPTVISFKGNANRTVTLDTWGNN